MFCLPCQFGLTRQRAGLGHCAIGACMIILPVMVLYGILAAVIVAPEMKMVSCMTDKDNSALIAAANDSGVCNPADPLHCSVARKLCPSIAELEDAVALIQYAISPFFYIFAGFVRLTRIHPSIPPLSPRLST